MKDWNIIEDKSNGDSVPVYVQVSFLDAAFLMNGLLEP